MAAMTTTVKSPMSERQRNKTAILRVFNYYRVFLSFALLLLFIQVPGQEFVGTHAPGLFQMAILGYIGINTTISLLALVLHISIVARDTVSFTIVVFDVIILSLMLYASGGVASGMAHFLIFPVAFAGVLIHGRVSFVIAAVAVIGAFYSEFNLMMPAGGVDSQRIFNLGVLGAMLFAVNGFFQYLTVQLRRKEEQVTTLQRLSEMQALAEQRQSELDSTNKRLEILLDSAGDGVLGLDLTGRITFANPRACQLLALTRDDVIRRNIAEFAGVEDALDNPQTSFQASNVLHQLELGSRQSLDTSNWRRGNGEAFPADYSCKATTDARGDIDGAVVVFEDATARKEVEAEMYHLANFDRLTDLVNRGFFQATMDKALARSRRRGDDIAVMLLDLDHFKYVNDQYGHDTGDEMLKQVAGRIRQCIRSCDTASRLGGDEFAIMLVDFGSTENLALIARNLTDSVARPIEYNGRSVDVSTSVGIAVFDRPDLSGDDLMKCADTAMYVAKTDGRNTYRFFRQEMQEEAEHTQRIQVALQNAVNRSEFDIHYQPIVSLEDSGSIHHSEALLRWNPTDEDPISPDIFIPIAEETGKINEIGDWVLRNVLKQIRRWHQSTGTYVTVAVNVSTRQLTDDTFRRQLMRYLREENLPPHVIEIELTETGVLRHPDIVLAELTQLHDAGIMIAIDDFGTGHSSLDYLRSLPIDFVKIDKTFVHGIGKRVADQNIIKVIVAIARTMNIKVIAEGIETGEQLRFLKDCGCHLGQGFIFSRPVAASDLIGSPATQAEASQEEGTTRKQSANIIDVSVYRERSSA